MSNKCNKKIYNVSIIKIFMVNKEQRVKEIKK